MKTPTARRVGNENISCLIPRRPKKQTRTLYASSCVRFSNKTRESATKNIPIVVMLTTELSEWVHAAGSWHNSTLMSCEGKVAVEFDGWT